MPPPTHPGEHLPGEHLKQELREPGMSAAEIARQLDVPTNRITSILNGQRVVTGDTAPRLAHFFGTTPQFWLNLKSLYDLRQAEQKSIHSIRSLPTLRLAQRTTETPPYSPHLCESALWRWGRR